MAAQLNDYKDETKKIIHLMITNRCDRKCAYCCNKQYNIDKIPAVTDDELKEAEIIFLTGGEPFAYADPDRTAKLLKQLYPNIKKVLVYTNAYELYRYLNNQYYPGTLNNIDGLTISIKEDRDRVVFSDFREKSLNRDERILKLSSNRLYVFKPYETTPCPESIIKIVRKWQEDFVPASNSIFRRASSII